MSPLGFSWGAKKRRTPGRKPRTYVPRKPRTTTVRKLARDVSKLKAVAMNRISYQGTDSFEGASAAGLFDYRSTPLFKFNNWTRIFGTDADDESNKQCLIRKCAGQWSVDTTEPDARSYSIFIVSLKDEASELLNTDGTLAPLTVGTHYSAPFGGRGCNVLLNLKTFNIHYHKVFSMGTTPMVKPATGGAGAVQNISNDNRSTFRYGKFNLKLGRGLMVKNPTQDWKAGVHPKDPSKNYYILTFWSGDSNLDLEVPNFRYSWITGVDVSA